MNKSGRRHEQEAHLHQHAMSVWIIGLSGSGKTTLANMLAAALLNDGKHCVVLDADDVRKGINAGLGYSLADRTENIRRAAEMAKILVDNGIIAINAFICPAHNMRALINTILGSENVYLIYLTAPISVCEQRDVKGLYAKAKIGQIADFTGIDAAFEVPGKADLCVDTHVHNEQACLHEILKNIEPKISFHHK